MIEYLVTIIAMHLLIIAAYFLALLIRHSKHRCDMTECPNCGAKPRGIFWFACGSIRPTFVNPSYIQSDGCRRIVILEAEQGKLFITGLQAMREMLARFVEQGGNPVIANSMRLNWNPSWGADPGRPKEIVRGV